MEANYPASMRKAAFRNGKAAGARFFTGLKSDENVITFFKIGYGT
jgi:hypothetical protein